MISLQLKKSDHFEYDTYTLEPVEIQGVQYSERLGMIVSSVFRYFLETEFFRQEDGFFLTSSRKNGDVLYQFAFHGEELQIIREGKCLAFEDAASLITAEILQQLEEVTKRFEIFTKGANAFLKKKGYPLL